MATKTAAPSVKTLNHIMDEIAEYLQEFTDLRRKMARVKDGSEKYFDLMSDITVNAMVLEAKMRSLINESDAITEAMPDDD